MKNLILLLLLFTVNFVIAQETKKYNFKDFTVVSVGWGMHVDISQSDSYNIEVNADAEDLKYLKVEKEGDELQFYIDKKNYRKEDEINIKISMLSLEAIELSGGSVGKVNMDISGKNFDCDLSGGSILNGKLNCGNINFDLSGGSQINLTGKAKDADIDGSGGAIFELKDFTVSNTNINLSGGSQVSINMNGTLNTSQSGGSQLTYYGNADIGETSFSGGSGIKKGN
jgi:hypothetical protein